ncbi:hypothetical protein [Mangrovihabitans endophyticus]|uniref:PH domain-containing protein n=1 Tax=Mangrovihabitans endophyticus TaxID=1751298 RepID=A0A8J3C4Y4_9ACTN|nr:hypothetical protein [Mangrovihabitans endophyticus]GGL19267.1 hypothetical protein GCM10012284_62240 [Mangrovihabitans endophyticus]
MIKPEQVTEPPGETKLFRSAPLRTFLVFFVIMLVVYVAVSPLVDLVLGASPDSWRATLAQGAIVAALVAGGWAVTARSARATWVRTSDDGLEIASQGSDPVMLHWADVDAAVVHRRGTRMVLEVMPSDMDRVHPVQDNDNGWPAMTETESGTAFTVELSQVWPGPRALRRELARHLTAAR